MLVSSEFDNIRRLNTNIRKNGDVFRLPQITIVASRLNVSCPQIMVQTQNMCHRPFLCENVAHLWLNCAELVFIWSVCSVRTPCETRLHS